MVMRYALSHLRKEVQATVLELSNVFAGPEDVLVGILRTNAYPLVQFEGDGVSYHALFELFSRLNHSCDPNVLPAWDETTFSVAVQTTKDVKKGQELLTTYIVPFQKRKERRSELLLKYKFECHCDWCDLDDIASAKKDEERERLAAAFLKHLVDANITRVPASVFYGAGATAHEGFYDELFPSNAGGPDGYSTIRSYVKALAQEMRGGRANGTGNAKIPLWVTGHSLGSALASLIFARFIQSPEDLGDDIELRDCYSYGTPRLGDGAFAASFERNLVTPIDRPNILWRVVNNFDIVCQVPPGLADSDHSRATLGLSVLNYSHIGTEVRLSPFWHPFFTINNAYFRSTTHSLLEDSMRPATAGERVSSRLASLNNAGFNPIRIALFPASYLGHLNQIDFSAQPVPSPEDEHAIGVGAGITDLVRGKGHWHAASLASGH
ncbi:hypothetical protein RQP46_009698 [Phenoliferia psychrophenolica]